MDIPEELTADLEAFAARWEEPALCEWLEVLPKQLAQSMSEKRYGDLKRWRESMHALPELTASAIKLDSAYVGAEGDITDITRADLEQALRGLHPWRKGPFSLLAWTSRPNGVLTLSGSVSRMRYHLCKVAVYSM